MRSLVSLAVKALAAELLVLLFSGVALVILYEPPGISGVSDGLRVTHRVAGWLAVATALSLVYRAARQRWWRGALLGGGSVVAALVAVMTGWLLPWEQLALWAVSLDTAVRGYLFDDSVRFVLIGTGEISTATLNRWLAVHSAVGLVVVGLWWLAWRWRPSAVREATNAAAD